MHLYMSYDVIANRDIIIQQVHHTSLGPYVQHVDTRRDHALYFHMSNGADNALIDAADDELQAILDTLIVSSYEWCDDTDKPLVEVPYVLDGGGDNTV